MTLTWYPIVDRQVYYMLPCDTGLLIGGLACVLFQDPVFSRCLPIYVIQLQLIISLCPALLASFQTLKSQKKSPCDEIYFLVSKFSQFHYLLLHKT